MEARMRKALLISLLALLSGCASGAVKNGDPKSIYVLGSIHGNMLDQQNNSLRDFVVALYLYEPTVILTETRPENRGAIEGTIEGGGEQSLVYAFAGLSGARVIPVDWFDDEYNRTAAGEDARMSPLLREEVAPVVARFREIVQTGTFEESQSVETQKLIRRRYDMLAREGLTSLRQRDKKICANIEAQKPRLGGERVLIVFGLAHKYALEDCLWDLSLKPLSIDRWYDATKAHLINIPMELRADAVKTQKSARDLLARRLQRNHYKTDVENMKDKLSELDAWIRETNDLR